MTTTITTAVAVRAWWSYCVRPGCPNKLRTVRSLPSRFWCAEHARDREIQLLLAAPIFRVNDLLRWFMRRRQGSDGWGRA